MNFAKPYDDLREFIAALDANHKLYRVHKEINKDSLDIENDEYIIDNNKIKINKL